MSDPRRILIVEDERDLAELLLYNLRREGYQVAAVHDGRAALRMIAAEPPDLVLLDLMLPQLSGPEVAARIRTDPATASLPIVMVTAKAADADQIRGLTLGADDYITKPFSIPVLLARVEAVLRRVGTAPAPPGPLRIDAVEVDLAAHEVRAGGRPVAVTLTEFRLLAALVQGGGRVLSRNALVARAMGRGVAVTERTIDVHMTSLRRKLGEHGRILRTVRGVGYRAAPESEAAET